jgi:hypothetical protein
LDSNLVNSFRNKFGPPERVLIGVGDWSEGSNPSHHMKYHAPTMKGIGIARIFRQYGYLVVKIFEPGTSKCCPYCGLVDGVVGLNLPFLKRENARPWKFDRVEVHGLLEVLPVVES